MNKALEELQAGREPFAPPPDEGNAVAFQNIARWSKWLTLVAAAFWFSVSWSLNKDASNAAVNRTILLCTAAVCGMLMMSSLVLGLIALCAIPKYGAEGILKPALRGIIVSLICFGFFGYGFSQGLKNRQALAAFEADAKKVRNETFDKLSSGKEITTDDGLKQLNAAQNVLDQATKNSTGDQAQLTRVMSAFLTKTKVVMGKYANAAEPLKTLARFDMSQVTNPSQLEANKQLVKNFIAANESYLTFAKNSEAILKSDLENAHLPQTTIDASMRGYHRGAAAQTEVAIKIREQDRIIGNSMLAAYDILQANWGKWKWGAEQRTVVFDDHVVWKKYIASLDAIDTADNEETRLQKQLLAYAKQ